MAQQSTIKFMKAVSSSLFVAAAGLISAGVVHIGHDDLLTGSELIGWALILLSLLLGFTLPVRCRVKRTNRKACGNWAYGLLFGCTNTAGHWSGKFLVRLRLKHDEANPVERRRSPGDTLVFNQPAPQSKPVKVTVEESPLAKCGFWIGLTSGIVGIIEAVASLIH